MAHFYGIIQGNRKVASRCGTKNSGIEGIVQGQDIGTHVRCQHNKETDEDEITIKITNGGASSKEFATINIRETSNKHIEITMPHHYLIPKTVPQEEVDAMLTYHRLQRANKKAG